MNEAYRVELEAAHARIAALEEELAVCASHTHLRALRREKRALEHQARKGFAAVTRTYNAVGVLVSLFFVLLSIPIGHLIQAQLVFWSFVMVVPSFAFAARLAGRARAIAREETNLRIAEIEEELDESEQLVGARADEQT